MSKFSDALERLKGWLQSPSSKIEGTFSMFNIRSLAQESALLSNRGEIMENNWSLDTASGEYLNEKVKDYGIYRRYGTYATGMVKFTGVDGVTIPIATVLIAPEYGVQFSTQSEVTIKDGAAQVECQCMSIGLSGNVPAGSITKIKESISGVNSVTNEAEFDGGSETEEDEVLRYRTYQKIRYPSTSGNVYDYQNWAMEISGVGAVRIVPLWNGPGTVKVSIIDSEGAPASPELIEEVQNSIDPDPQQQGGGKAPVGALVTVSTATPKDVNVSAKIEVGVTSDIETIKEEFTQALKDYFKEIAYDDDVDSLSIARVGFILFEVKGVVDYTNLTINGGTSSILIGKEEVFQVGTVDLTQA